MMGRVTGGKGKKYFFESPVPRPFHFHNSQGLSAMITKSIETLEDKKR
jgi:hypothetical protein